MYHIIPDNFFSPLASPNKHLYWECICKLFGVMDHQLSFGVEREVLVDELQYYLEQNNAIVLVGEDGVPDSRETRIQANWILNKLREHGWIEVVTDKNYIQKVNFRDYAVKIIRTLLEISKGRQMEYQGYIYTIYTLARARSDHPGIVLMQILENTDLLITGLKNLNSNIKHYIDDLTRHQSVAQIMDALFNDYITNIVDKAYHRLRTSDNVAKFRPEIIQKLEAKARSRTYVPLAAQDIAQTREISPEEAEELVYRWIHQIIDAFQNMDEILAEIDAKNTQYQRSAVNRARFLMSSSEDVRGQLREILMAMNEKIQEEDMQPSGIYRIDFIEDLIRLYSVSVLDESSFYTPVEGRKEFFPAELIADEADEELRMKKLRLMAEKLQRVMTPEKIDDYVSAVLQGKTQLQACAFPLETEEDFVKLIYVRLYGQRKNMKYRVETLEEVSIKGYRFRDFLIRRK